MGRLRSLAPPSSDVWFQDNGKAAEAMRTGGYPRVESMVIDQHKLNGLPRWQNSRVAQTFSQNSTLENIWTQEANMDSRTKKKTNQKNKPKVRNY